MNVSQLMAHSGVLLVCSSVLFGGGTLLLAKFAQTGHGGWAVGSIIFLAPANAFYVELMRLGSLGTAYILSSMSTMLIICAASWVLFHEPVRWPQIVAIGFGLCAIVASSLPGGEL